MRAWPLSLAGMILASSACASGAAGSDVSEALTPATEPVRVLVTADSAQEPPPAPTEEPFHLPGGTLLIGALTVPQAERDTIRDGWWSTYYWLGLPDGEVELHSVLRGDDPVRDRPVVLSPDQRRIIFMRETYAAGGESIGPQSRIIYLLGPDDEQPVQIGPPVKDGFIKGFVWSLDSRFVAFWNVDEWSEFGEVANNTIHIYDTQTGALNDLSVNAIQPGAPALSPNGDRVAFANETRDPDSEGLYLINSDGTDEHLLVAGAIYNPQWHPDGTRLIFEQADISVDPATGFRHIYSYDLGSGVVVMLTPADQSSYWFVLSPDGRSLTYVSEGDMESRLSVVGTDGGAPVELTRGSGLGTASTWSPDSQYLAYFESGVIHIMDSRGRGQVQVYDGFEAELIAWLP